jgi:MoaA/NifB/PqqE/SkfB family radical SAM enzyme
VAAVSAAPAARLRTLGWFDGERAFVGPRTVQVDLTDACNQHCQVCWLHADTMRPLAGERASRPASLSWELFSALLASLRTLRTEEIYFAGGGEPLAHPRAWDALALCVRSGFTTSLHTNLSLVGEGGAARIVDLGVHHLTVSLWAGDLPTWQLTHPGSRTDVWEQVQRDLREILRRRVDRPKVKAYHVLTRGNAEPRAFASMVQHAEDLGADAVEFAVADVVPGGTDHLAVTAEQARALLPQVEALAPRAPWRRPRVFGLDALRERLAAAAGGRLFDAEAVHRIPCFAGWSYARVLADGRVIPCLKAHRIPSGSLHEADFAAIWTGARQREFRRATAPARKRSPLLSRIGNDPAATCGCELGCDNRADNEAEAQRIRSMGRLERVLARWDARHPTGAPV